MLTFGNSSFARSRVRSRRKKVRRRPPLFGPQKDGRLRRARVVPEGDQTPASGRALCGCRPIDLQPGPCAECGCRVAADKPYVTQPVLPDRGTLPRRRDSDAVLHLSKRGEVCRSAGRGGCEIGDRTGLNLHSCENITKINLRLTNPYSRVKICLACER